MMIDDNDDNESVASVESNKFVAVTNSMNPANSPNPAKKTRISSVKGRPQFTKRNKQKAESEMETKLKEKLNSKKDEDRLYGDLLATRLRVFQK